MSSIATERPLFFEGQYLGADDLTAIINYVRANFSRENIGHHSWGIVAGLNLVAQAITDTAVDYFIQPGVAVDGFGRIVVITSPARITSEKFLNMSSGNIDVWIRYDQSEFSATRTGFQICNATDTYARMNETFAIEVGSKNSIASRQSGIIVNELIVNDARDTLINLDADAPILADASVPYQQLPVDDENAYWLIPIGQVRWSAADNNFLPLVDAAEAEAVKNGTSIKTADEVFEAEIRSRCKRIYSGAIAESVYASDGLIRLRDRTLLPQAGKTNDQIVAATVPQNSDFAFCDNQLKARELIWLEGNTRSTGDFRLFDSRLEFRDAAGRDYVERTVNGAVIPASSPLLIQRKDVNGKGGSDLQILLGENETGINRLTVGSISFKDETLCSEGKTPANKIVFQHNGRMGIGTVAPDTNLLAPLTIRGLSEEITENAGTADEIKFTIERLINLENTEGNLMWEMDLWSDKKSLSLNETTVGESRVYVQAGGNIGIGTTEPGAKLDITNVTSHDIWLRVGNGGDEGRVWIDYGPAAAPRLVLSDDDDAPRIQFQQTQSTDPEQDINPALVSWLGHAAGGSANIALMGGFFGVNTQSPVAPLTVQGNSGSTRFYSGQSGGHVWLGFYNDGAPGTARAGWLGYANDGNLNFTIANEKNTGDIILAPDRNVGIGTSNPSSKLEVRGDITLGSAGQYYAVTAEQKFHTVAGRISSAGIISSGEGFAVSRISNGHYVINFIPAFAAIPIVVATAVDNSGVVVSVPNSSVGACTVQCQNMSGIGTPMDCGFNFIATGAR
jgi:hypothetical protein